MQKKELNIILQADYRHGNHWVDIIQFKCGIRRIDYNNAIKDSKKYLEDYRTSSPENNYRLIRRYI